MIPTVYTTRQPHLPENKYRPENKTIAVVMLYAAFVVYFLSLSNRTPVLVGQAIAVLLGMWMVLGNQPFMIRFLIGWGLLTLFSVLPDPYHEATRFGWDALIMNLSAIITTSLAWKLSWRFARCAAKTTLPRTPFWQISLRELMYAIFVAAIAFKFGHHFLTRLGYGNWNMFFFEQTTYFTAQVLWSVYLAVSYTMFVLFGIMRERFSWQLMVLLLIVNYYVLMGYLVIEEHTRLRCNPPPYAFHFDFHEYLLGTLFAWIPELLQLILISGPLLMFRANGYRWFRVGRADQSPAS